MEIQPLKLVALAKQDARCQVFEPVLQISGWTHAQFADSEPLNYDRSELPVKNAKIPFQIIDHQRLVISGRRGVFEHLNDCC